MFLTPEVGAKAFAIAFLGGLLSLYPNDRRFNSSEHYLNTQSLLCEWSSISVMMGAIYGYNGGRHH